MTAFVSLGSRELKGRFEPKWLLRTTHEFHPCGMPPGVLYFNLSVLDPLVQTSCLTPIEMLSNYPAVFRIRRDTFYNREAEEFRLSFYHKWLSKCSCSRSFFTLILNPGLQETTRIFQKSDGCYLFRILSTVKDPKLFLVCVHLTFRHLQMESCATHEQ